MKKTILIIMIATLLLLSACSKTADTPTDSTYIGGNEGLKLNFAIDAPPLTTADNKQQSFDIITQIQNKGETEVKKEDADITIEGFLPDSFGKTKTDLQINPEENIERRIRTPEGAIIEPPYVEAIVSNLTYQNREPGNINLPIRANICYLYETRVATKLCIKDDMLKQNSDDLCTINANRELSSSGAPVQISKVSQTGAGRDKTRFTFTIANVDTGKVYKKNTACDSNTQEENKVFVEILNLDNSNVKCTGLQSGNDAHSGYVTLAGGTPRDVTCTASFTQDQRTNRLQPFNIRLSYNYDEYIETSIDVQYTPEEGSN